MRLNWQYFLYIGLLHLLLGVMAYWLLEEATAWLLLIEVGLLLSLGIA
jgi:hypothetical protein